MKLLKNILNLLRMKAYIKEKTQQATLEEILELKNKDGILYECMLKLNFGSKDQAIYTVCTRSELYNSEELSLTSIYSYYIADNSNTIIIVI